LPKIASGPANSAAQLIPELQTLRQATAWQTNLHEASDGPCALFVALILATPGFAIQRIDYFDWTAFAFRPYSSFMQPVFALGRIRELRWFPPYSR
jgi:hypothetical protein